MTVSGVLWTVIIGLVVGVLAKLLMPGRDPGGIFITILIGIAGSFLGTLIGSQIWGRGYQAGIIMSIIGSLILLGLYRLIKGRTA